MTGTDFIEKAREIRPEAIYLVVSAYSDRDYVLDAIKRGHVYDYVLKPWRRSELLQILQDAFKMYQERQLKADRLHNLEQERDELAEKADLYEETQMENQRLVEALRGYNAPEDPEEDGKILFSNIERAKKLSLKETLKHARGNISEAARLLDVPISTLYYRLKKHGLLESTKKMA